MDGYVMCRVVVVVCRLTDLCLPQPTVCRELQAATAAIDINNAPGAAAPPAPAPAPAPTTEAAATAAPTAATAALPPPAMATTAVLSALDDLEQELGLGDLSSSLLASSASGGGQQAAQAPTGAAAAGAGGGTAAGAGGLDGLDDDLGEFEDFLEVSFGFGTESMVDPCGACID